MYKLEKRKPINITKFVFIRSIFDLRLASIFFSIRNHLKKFRGNVLDVGCGNQPYRNLIKNANYHGIDHIAAKTFSMKTIKDIKYYNGIDFPESSDSYDVVLHTEVLEHIKDTNYFLKECSRVLKKNGKMLFTIPFSYRFHYIPNDYYRYTPSALHEILLESGFNDIKIINQGTDITVACYKLITVFFRLLTEKNNLILKIVHICVTTSLLPILFVTNFIGLLSIILNWGSKDDCLGYLVISSK
jgi:SAM-dependent methyltransferase